LFGGGKKTSAGLGQAFESGKKDPVGSVKGFVSTFGEDPIYYASQYYGFGKGLKTVGSGVKQLGRLRYLGKQYVSAEKIIEPQVLSGAKRFPETSGGAKALVSKFKSGKYFESLGEKQGGYHATVANTGRKLVVQTGTSETPGIYVAPSVSKYFLRLTGETGRVKITALPKIQMPKILFFKTQVSRIPSAYRGTLSKAQSFFFKGKGQAGKAYVSPAFEFGLKPESEVIIQVGSQFQRTGLGSLWQKVTGFSKYTKIGGQRIPIQQYSFSGFTKQVVKPSAFTKYFSGELGYSYAPIVTPSRIGYLFSSSYKPSYSYESPSVYRSYSFASKPSKSISFSEAGKSYSSFGEPSKAVSFTSGSSYTKQPYDSTTYTPPEYSSFTYTTTPKYNIPSYTPPPYKITTTTTPPPSKTKEEPYSFLAPKKKPLYHGYVREGVAKGRAGWIKVTEKAQPKNVAWNQAIYVADNTTGRSVTVKPTSKKSIGFDDPYQNLQKFRKKAKRSKISREPVFIEKSTFAIDSIGEKQQLSVARFKAQQKNQFMQGFGRLF